MKVFFLNGLEFWTSVEKRRQCARRNLQHTKSGAKQGSVALYESFSIFHYHYAVQMEGSNSGFHQPSILAWISQYAKYSCFWIVLSICQVCFFFWVKYAKCAWQNSSTILSETRISLQKKISYFPEKLDSLVFHWVGDYDNSLSTVSYVNNRYTKWRKCQIRKLQFERLFFRKIVGIIFSLHFHDVLCADCHLIAQN